MTADESAEPLASLSVRDFVEILGARTAAPGGGSAAALMASMGSALVRYHNLIVRKTSTSFGCWEGVAFFAERERERERKYTQKGTHKKDAAT